MLQRYVGVFLDSRFFDVSRFSVGAKTRVSRLALHHHVSSVDFTLVGWDGYRG